MQGVFEVSHAALDAAQKQLENTRGEFSHAAPQQASALRDVQNSAKWGIEVGPLLARRQYSSSIDDIRSELIDHNAELIAFLMAVDATQRKFKGDEAANLDQVQYLTEQFEAMRGLSRSRAEFESEGKTVGKFASSLLGVLAPLQAAAQSKKA